MIDAKRLAELMTPEKLRELADAFDEYRTSARPVLTHADLDCVTAVLREVARLKSRTSMEIRDTRHGKEFIFRAMYSGSELRERVGQSRDIVTQCGMEVRRAFENELREVMPEIRRG